MSESPLINHCIGVCGRELGLFITHNNKDIDGNDNEEECEEGKTVSLILFDDNEIFVDQKDLIALTATMMGLQHLCIFRGKINRDYASYLKFENDSDGSISIDYRVLFNEEPVEPVFLDVNIHNEYIDCFPTDEDIKKNPMSCLIKEKGTKTEQAALTMFLVRRVAQSWGLSVDETLSLLRVAYRSA